MRTMALHQLVAEVAPSRAKRSVSPSANSAVPDALYWSMQMVAVATQRDRASFMRIYDHFAPRLRCYLGSLGMQDSMADELVQEALLTLWRKAGMFDPSRASLATWLFRVARNLYIDHVRQQPEWLPIQKGLERLEEAEFGRPDSQPESFFDQDILKQAIDRLPPVQAKLIRMCYLESRSHSEISDELQMPLGSVKSSLRRAFSKLQGSMRASR